MSSSSTVAPARAPVSGVRTTHPLSIDELEEKVESYETSVHQINRNGIISDELAGEINKLSGEIALEYGNKVLSGTSKNSNYNNASQQTDRLLGLLIRLANILTTKVDQYLKLEKKELEEDSSTASTASTASATSTPSSVVPNPFIATKSHSTVASVLKKRSTRRRSRSSRKTRKH